MNVVEATVLVTFDFEDDDDEMRDEELYGRNVEKTLDHHKEAFIKRVKEKRVLEAGYLVFALVTFAYSMDLNGESIWLDGKGATSPKQLEEPLNEWYDTNIKSPIMTCIESIMRASFERNICVVSPS